MNSIITLESYLETTEAYFYDNALRPTRLESKHFNLLNLQKGHYNDSYTLFCKNVHLWFLYSSDFGNKLIQFDELTYIYFFRCSSTDYWLKGHTYYMNLKLL